MRIVAYARVSTLAQETEGASLDNQERALTRWLEKTGHTLVSRYREAASAGTIAGRTEFLRMLDELPKTKPDAVVIETLDRFTRDLGDGLNLLKELRGKGIGLLPLDWRREKPINLDDDRDWRDVVDEFTSAESERRRIRRRVIRAYEGRRERGATTVYKTPLGVLKQGDRLVPDPATAWIIHEIDRRILARESTYEVATWCRTVAGAFTARMSITCAIRNRNYVVAGVRDEATQAALDQYTEMGRTRIGHGSKHQHILTGAVACGYCVELGFAPEESIMFGGINAGYAGKGPRVYVTMLKCERGYDQGASRHPLFSTAEHRVLPSWDAYVEKISHLLEDRAAMGRWIARDRVGNDEKRAALERRLAQLDQRGAAVKQRRDRAFDMLGDKGDAVDRQARQALREIDGDEMEIHATREAILSEMRRTESPARDEKALRDMLRGYRKTYAKVSSLRKNELNRLLCRATGSFPLLKRVGPLGKHPGKGPGAEAVFWWPEMDEILSNTASRSILHTTYA